MTEARATGRDRAAAIQRVFLGLLAANVVVVGAKVVIGLSTGSLSVLGDAIHSSVDAFNNIAFIALVRFASRGPDHNHPYGHGKFEVLGAVGVPVFLSVAVFELLEGAVGRLAAAGPPPQLSRVDILVLGLTLVLNVWVAWYENRRGRELQSDLLLADAAHTRVDVFITIGVIGGAFLARRGVAYADPAIAILISALIVRIGYQIVRRAMPVLTDEAAHEAHVIQRTAERVAGVRAAYHIRSRGAASSAFAEITISVAGGQSVDDAHRIADAVEASLKRELGLTEVVVHVEPSG